MQRVVVAAAIRAQVVPQHRHALLGRDDEPDVDERGLAAFLDVVEINHERPGALSERRRRVALELIRFEVVRVRLEFLRDLVVLPLAWLGERRIDAHRAADLLVERAYRRLAADEIAGAARAERGVRAAVVADGGGPQL